MPGQTESATTLKDPRRYFEAVDAKRSRAAEAAAGLPLSRGHQPLQPAVRNLPAHLRGRSNRRPT